MKFSLSFFQLGDIFFLPWFKWKLSTDERARTLSWRVTRHSHRARFLFCSSVYKYIYFILDFSFFFFFFFAFIFMVGRKQHTLGAERQQRGNESCYFPPLLLKAFVALGSTGQVRNEMLEWYSKLFGGSSFPLLHGPNDSKATARRKQQLWRPLNGSRQKKKICSTVFFFFILFFFISFLSPACYSRHQ